MEAFDEQTQQWVGKNADELVTRKGPPTSTFTLSNGNRVFQYESSENWPGAYSIFGGGTSPVASANLNCSVRFTVDTSNTIIAWSKDGNYCVAGPEAKK